MAVNCGLLPEAAPVCFEVEADLLIRIRQGGTPLWVSRAGSRAATPPLPDEIGGCDSRNKNFEAGMPSPGLSILAVGAPLVGGLGGQSPRRPEI